MSREEAVGAYLLMTITVYYSTSVSKTLHSANSVNESQIGFLLKKHTFSKLHSSVDLTRLAKMNILIILLFSKRDRTISISMNKFLLRA